mmetsp:Transcript_16636/g.63025  ORF Transcript_16636/g.63025 Transcript_16636/m.63025 type:complete len:321 (+) Transcript_16636:1557-2519(+)
MPPPRNEKEAGAETEETEEAAVKVTCLDGAEVAEAKPFPCTCTLTAWAPPYAAPTVHVMLVDVQFPPVALRTAQGAAPMLTFDSCTLKLARGSRPSPVMVTTVPRAPEDGLTEEMSGVYSREPSYTKAAASWEVAGCAAASLRPLGASAGTGRIALGFSGVHSSAMARARREGTRDAAPASALWPYSRERRREAARRESTWERIAVARSPRAVLTCMPSSRRTGAPSRCSDASSSVAWWAGVARSSWCKSAPWRGCAEVSTWPARRRPRLARAAAESTRERRESTTGAFGSSFAARDMMTLAVVDAEDMEIAGVSISRLR